MRDVTRRSALATLPPSLEWLNRALAAVAVQHHVHRHTERREDHVNQRQPPHQHLGGGA
jgi:hypothetical protein